MKTIPVGRGLEALVDDADYAWLSMWDWHATKDGYAIRYEKRGGVKKQFLMHRVILNAPEGSEVDHRFGNRLDNRRSEIRLATHAENHFGFQRYRAPKASRFRGVTWHKGDRRWQAQIKVSGRYKYLGSFVDEAQAAAVRDQAAVKYFGEFAAVNRIPQ